jgi:hypothetical protein
LKNPPRVVIPGSEATRKLSFSWIFAKGRFLLRGNLSSRIRYIYLVQHIY